MPVPGNGSLVPSPLRSRLALALVVSGISTGAVAVSSTSSAAPSTAPTTAPVAKPQPKIQDAVITKFERVLPAGGPMQSLAVGDGPLTLRVWVKNMSGTQLSTTARVTRMPKTRDEATLGAFDIAIPAGETRSFTFSDAKALHDGCSPTRWSIELETGGSRIGYVKPSCSFAATTVATGRGPQGSLSATPACGQPWNVSAQVTPPAAHPYAGQPQSSGTLSLTWAVDATRFVGSTSVPASNKGPVTATITSPFPGVQGIFTLKYAVPSITQSGSQTLVDEGSKIDVKRTCTVDLGALE